jgi:hypothetical protein
MLRWRYSGKTAKSVAIWVLRECSNAGSYSSFAKLHWKPPEGLDTRELAFAAIRAMGMNEDDKVLRKAVSFRIVQIMLRQELLGRIVGSAKRKGVRVWRNL